MKTLSHTGTQVTKDVVTAQPTLKVCMHLLGTARTDYRVMRGATALAEAGFMVTIIDVEAERTRPAEEDICGVHVKHIISPSWFIPTGFKPWFLVKMMLMLIVGTVRLLQTQADIYHAHLDKALPACYLAARLHRKLLILDAPEMPLSDPTVTRWHRLNTLATRIFTGMLPYCVGVIATSSPTAQAICNRYGVRTVTLIRNVPTYRVVPKSDRLGQYLGLGPDVRIALYQGNLQPNRELDRLVRAASYLEPGIVIVMMGRGVGATQAQLEALIASERVADRVKILPPVPYAELLDWTASADIGLTIFSPDYSPNIRMTLPNKFFEYLMVGLPVLTSPLEAVTELVKTYDVGQIAPSLAPAEVGAAINTMLADRLALDRMRGNALEGARQEFNWEKESLVLIRLYHKILGIRNTENTTG